MDNAHGKATPEDRLRIVRLIDEQNRDPQLVADVLGVSRSQVHEWLSRYREGGPDALRSGGPLGRPTAISEHQVRDLYGLMRNREPREFGFRTSLWTRVVVGSLIRREFDMSLSQPTVAKILDRLGLHTVRETSPALDETTSGILIRAKAAKAGAKVLFGRVSHVSRGARFGGGEQDHMISAVDGRGRTLFFVSPVPPDAGRLIDFYAGLLRDVPKPMFLVVLCPSDRSLAEIREFVDECRGRLRLFILRTMDDGKDFIEV